MNRAPIPALVTMLSLSACGHGAVGDDGAEADRIVERLEAGQVVIGSIVQERSPEGAASLAADVRIDYAFYDMQREYDLERFLRFETEFRAAGDQALLVRIPPLSDDPEAAAERVEELLAVGVEGIIFPHVRSREEAAFGVELLRGSGRGVWPLDATGVVGHFMIEDLEGLENVLEIVSTPGVGIASPGEGSLRSVLDGDAAAVEEAIQKILATCLRVDVVCAKLVSEHEIEQRLQEGFRVLLVSGALPDG